LTGQPAVAAAALSYLPALMDGYESADG